MMKSSAPLLNGLTPKVRKALQAIYGDMRDKRRFTFADFIKTRSMNLKRGNPNSRKLSQSWRYPLDNTLMEMDILRRYKNSEYYVKRFSTLEGWARFQGDTFLKDMKRLETEGLVNAIKRERIKKTRKILDIEKRFDRDINELLAELYLEKSLSTYEIAKDLEISNATVLNWLKKCRIASNNGQTVEKPGKRELKNLYVKQRKSTLQIAKEFRISVSTAHKWLKDYGIKTRDRSSAQLNGNKKPTMEKLKRLYQDNDMSISKIANRLGYPQPTIYKWLGEYGLR